MSEPNTAELFDILMQLRQEKANSAQQSLSPQQAQIKKERLLAQEALFSVLLERQDELASKIISEKQTKK